MKNIKYLKSYLFIFFTLLWIGVSVAQDTIIKINGEQINAKIIEITSISVKFKKANFLDGPTYIENKTDILSIKYSNGSIDNFHLPLSIQPTTVQKNDSISKTPKITATDDYYLQPEKVQSSPTQPAVQKQNSVSKTSDKIVADDYYNRSETISGSKTGQLNISKKVFKQSDAIISEKEFYNILKQTNDKEIMVLVDKAGKAKKRQYISFDCILGGSVFFLYPPLFFLVEPIPILLYYKYRAVRKNCNKKAVELYNKKQ